MVFNRFIWDNYCQTLRGQNKIKEFARGAEATDMELVEQVKAFNKDAFQFFTPEAFIDALGFFQFAYGKMLESSEVRTIDEARELYASIAETEIRDESQKVVMPARDYQFLLQGNIALSYVLNFFHPDYFIPNLYCFNFGAFIRLCDCYEDIELPEIPKKSDYRARYLYYAEMCRVLYEFRTRRGISSAELCAFLYDFAPASIEEEEAPKELPQPSAVWCIGGAEDAPEGLWQCNEETRRGDIILYYQKAPKSAITHIFRADTDGLIDPFFHFYSRTRLCCPVLIPDITRKELQTDEYFAEHPLVKKNFQGVNGWPLKFADYQRILDILSGRGFDISILPTLSAADFTPEHDIRAEKDVEEYLLNPYLKECGVTERDYIRQMPLHMGRGDVKYPDYAVFARTTDGYETARVLIEAKLEIRNNREREEAFKQARSYALRLESEYIILCDRNAAWVYEGADRVNYERYSWGELRKADVFARMKRLFADQKRQNDVQMRVHSDKRYN